MKNTARLIRGSAPRFAAQSSAIALCAFSLAAAAPAYAAGTLAGTDITNTASATYDVGGTPVSLDSNTSVITVDELLDVTVNSTDPGDVATDAGSNGNVLTFQVTNTGNGSEAFTLTANTANGGDDFDPVFTQIVLDTNGNGEYDPGVDTVYVPGANDPVLAPDGSIVVFVITNTPATAGDGDRGVVTLDAEAVTGSGTPGTPFPGAGQGGGDAVVGSTGADGSDNGALIVSAASVAFVKSATISGPLGTNPVPGATITYSLVATVTGSGSINNLVITDPIPVGVNYVNSSLTLDSVSLSDAADADAGTYNGTQISVNAGNVAGGQTKTVTFQVIIP